MKHYTLILATLLSLLIPVQSWGEETKSCPCCDDACSSFEKVYDLINKGEISFFTFWLKTLGFATQGDINAQFALAEIEYGRKEFVSAHSWFFMSYVGGLTDAKKRLDEVAKQLTPEQLEKAQKFSEKCSEKEYQECWTIKL